MTISPYVYGTGCSRKQSSPSNYCVRQTSTKKLSAYAYLFGNYDCNRLPLAPLGCAVQVNIPPGCRTSWGVRARKGWYIGCAWDHYRLHTYVENVTKRDKMSGAIDFKQKSRTNPTMTDYDKNMRAIQDLEAKLTLESQTCREQRI